MRPRGRAAVPRRTVHGRVSPLPSAGRPSEPDHGRQSSPLCMSESRGTLRTSRDPLIGLVAQLVLLAALVAAVGLGPAGWAAGVACGAAIDALLARRLLRNPSERLGPAGWVTLARATLAVGVAALTVDAAGG